MAPPAKRQKTQPAIEEITFDLSARQEFLTGFHKRKVQRAKHAQEKAEQRARQEKIDERKKLREDRKAELARHVQAVNDMLKPASLEVETSSGEDEDISTPVNTDEWTGIRDPSPAPINREAEYIDEDKYTTVTVETVDVTRYGISRVGQEADARSSDSGNNEHIQAEDGKPAKLKLDNSKSIKRSWTKDRPVDKAKRPKKKRNFRYEGKTERKANRSKEKLKKKKQAQARRSG